MSRHILIFIVALVILVGLLLSTVMYMVDQTRDIVMVKTFGKLGPPQQGAEAAGLKFKWLWPIQKVVRLPSRVNVLEDSEQQMSTKDGKSILVNMYCTWRIVDAVKFYNAVEDVETAQTRLRDRLAKVKSDVIANHYLSDLVNTDPAKMKLAQIEEGIHKMLAPQILSDYGIEVDKVGVKVLGLPQEISGGVIEAQKAEREREAKTYRADGEAQATAITSRAESARDQILAFAQRKADSIRSEGQRDASKYFATFSQDQRLSMFLRELDSLKIELKNNSVFILDGSKFYDRPSVTITPTTQPKASGLPK